MNPPPPRFVESSQNSVPLMATTRLKLGPQAKPMSSVRFNLSGGISSIVVSPVISRSPNSRRKSPFADSAFTASTFSPPSATRAAMSSSPAWLSSAAIVGAVVASVAAARSRTSDLMEPSNKGAGVQADDTLCRQPVIKALRRGPDR